MLSGMTDIISERLYMKCEENIPKENTDQNWTYKAMLILGKMALNELMNKSINKQYSSLSLRETIQ